MSKLKDYPIGSVVKLYNSIKFRIVGHVIDTLTSEITQVIGISEHDSLAPNIEQALNPEDDRFYLEKSRYGVFMSLINGDFEKMINRIETPFCHAESGEKDLLEELELKEMPRFLLVLISGKGVFDINFLDESDQNVIDSYLQDSFYELSSALLFDLDNGRKVGKIVKRWVFDAAG